MTKKPFGRLRVVPLAILAAQLFVPSARADHSWAGLHWARAMNPFTLQLGDNVSGLWDSVLGLSSVSWSQSAELDTTIVVGKSNVKRCSATAGQVEVCNSKYGRNGWLGLASVWASDSHITQATVKLNDTYFATTYNTEAWRKSVMCQELGHTLGLGHNDEDFETVNGTCMDYANDPTNNQEPNPHDFEELAKIYEHTSDSSTTVGASTGSARTSTADLHGQDEWGRAIRYDSKGRPVVFERNLGPSERVFTFVIWAE
ncbi:MAG TPA: hypothetical protein VK988_03275 [Acidimicrobiales bacterium]|nr:hypothetical protein [Acidimicrobiales bacterium]